MFKDREYINQFTDIISEGFIFIDSKGTIEIYNKKAKEIFGVIYNQGKGHPSGKIEEGDILIIADNSIGEDDGGLGPKDLEVIGIRDEKINRGDGIIALGVYKDNKIKPIYKVHEGQLEETFSLDSKYMGNHIKVAIDFHNKSIKISVNGEAYDMEYIRALGHIVVISGKTGKVKFYQAKGYTIRKESIYDILMEKEYMAKGKNINALNVIGKNIFEVHGYLPDIKEFHEVAQGKELSYRDRFIDINGRPTLCTLVPINNKGKRAGALLKVKDISELKKLASERDEALFKLEKTLEENKGVKNLFPNIIGESPKISNVKSLLKKASKSYSTVLILGESGTGKGLMAREIHRESDMWEKPFIHVNCASIPETLLESELFGYEGGAFTGANTRGKIGFFEMAQGGTIFLDEIAEIPTSMQVKLLQVLQNKSFYRVGGSKEITVDVRIISATNKNLEQEVSKGSFREDLFYRINVFPIWIPPLRERKEDIYSLVYSILPKICKRVGCENKHISGEALKKLIDYNWPGNVRQLENVLERGVNLCEGNTILSRHIHIDNSSKEANDDVLPLKDVVGNAEKEAMIQALTRFNGDKKKAIRALKIGKTSFYEKLKKYNI